MLNFGYSAFNGGPSHKITIGGESSCGNGGSAGQTGSGVRRWLHGVSKGAHFHDGVIGPQFLERKKGIREFVFLNG